MKAGRSITPYLSASVKMATVHESEISSGNQIDFTSIEEYSFLIAHDSTECRVEPSRVMIPAHHRRIKKLFIYFFS